MKICFVTESPYPWDGTPAREIEFANGLAKAGHEVHVIFPYLPEKAREMEKLSDLILHYSNSPMYNHEFLKQTRNSFYYLNMVRKIRDEIDVFQYSNHGRAFLGSFYKEFLDLPTLASIHATQTRTISNPFGWFIDINERTIAKHSDAVLLTTDYAKKYFLKKHSDYLKGKCLVAPNTVDMAEVKNLKKELPPLTERKPIIATFSSEKKLLPILQRLSNKIPNIKGLKIGKTSGQKIDSDLIEYTGYVDDLDEVLKNVKLGFLWGDQETSGGFRSQVTDFIKRGIPFIGYPPSRMRSWRFAIEIGAIKVLNSENTLENATEIIFKILSDEKKQAKLSEKCYESIEKISYENVIPTLERAYKSIIDTKSK